jgi:probable DNA repair protein
MEAHSLICSYAPQLLRTAARAGWVNDPAAFSRWLATFDETCRQKNTLSPARLPVELIQVLEATFASRPPLLLAGFDRFTPTQRALLAAWGECHELNASGSPATIHFHRVPHEQAEFEACALWAAQRLDANAATRILILTQDASTRRGELERAFLRHLPAPAATPLFEFSLGVPLSQIPLPRAAQLLLRWLAEPIAENELDWLLNSGHACANDQETASLQAHMRALRRHGLERPEWTLHAFLESRSSGLNSAVSNRNSEASHSSGLYAERALPTEWVTRINKAQSRLSRANRQPQSPLEWADLVPRLLEDLAWPGAHPLSSAQFQAHRRFLQAVDSAGSLGFDGRRIRWSEWTSILARTLDQTLYAPESRNAPIQIAGPAESAGLAADAIWFLGANENNWPGKGSTHPLLPLEIQRAYAMPHATGQLDWDLAQSITARLIHTATEVRFSCTSQVEGTPSRPSRLIAQIAGQPLGLPSDFAPVPSSDPLTHDFNDASLIPFPPGQAPGGSDVLTAQSACPFKAFATTRLAAKGWDFAAAGLTPAQRGQLLHAVLHSVWSGPPIGIRSRTDLAERSANGLRPFIALHVERSISNKLASSVRDRMPARYLEIEAERLTRLVIEWLTFESRRAPFTVLGTEIAKNVNVEGLELRLRLDRIDQLIDDTLLVVDYKSGNASPNAWGSDRPEDVQLPLYATFALAPNQQLGGLVFAKVLAGKPSFAGRALDAQATLLTSLSATNALVKAKLTTDLQDTWSNTITRLARDFLHGRADVDPRDFPNTCKNCDLHAVCRIAENQHLIESDEDDEEEADID